MLQLFFFFAPSEKVVCVCFAHLVRLLAGLLPVTVVFYGVFALCVCHGGPGISQYLSHL